MKARSNKMLKNLPKELTSYDLLKALAVILMICDHVGHHFFPDEMWFRILGRLCIPIWFFLVGYARNTEIRSSFVIGAIIVGASAVISGQFVLPLNILVTIIILRLIRDRMVVGALHTPEGLRGFFFIMIFLTLPSAVVAEYGSISALFVVFGFFVRNKDVVYKRIERRYMILFVLATFLIFFLIEGVMMPSVTLTQGGVLLLGFALVGWMLWSFKPIVFTDSKTGAFVSRSFVILLQFLGRRTLEIYVAHIVIFRLVCMVLYPDQYVLLNWHIAPMGVIAPFL